MQLQDFYPIVVTEHLVACRDFYRRWFGLEVVFEASWFVLLAAAGVNRASLAFMHPSHPSAPPGPETFNGKGLCLEFQVADAAAEFARFQSGGASLVLQLRDEPFGQRRFGLFDPAGVWIDVVEQIEAATGWWALPLLSPDDLGVGDTGGTCSVGWPKQSRRHSTLPGRKRMLVDIKTFTLVTPC